MVERTADALRARAEVIVSELSAEHGSSLMLHSRPSNGMQTGAWVLVDQAGVRSILKYRSGIDVTELRAVATKVFRLRWQGYPTPAWLALGCASTGEAYHLQEFAPGEPAYPLTVGKARLLIELLERHAGLDPWPERDRSADILRTASDESSGGLRHGVRELGADGAALLATYDELVRSAGPIALPRGDLVHGDFNTVNLLLADGAVSAVIDIEDLSSGTRVIDYACLLREAYLQEYGTDVERLVRRAAEAVAGPGPLAVCTAAAAFFIVGFKRRHQPDDVGATLAGLHRLAADLAVPL